LVGFFFRLNHRKQVLRFAQNDNLANLFGYGFDQEFRPGTGLACELVDGGSERAVSLGDAGPHYAKAGGGFAMLHADQVTAAQFTAKADQQASTDTDVS